MGKRKKNEEALVTGLVLAAGFGVAWVLTGWWWWIFPVVFAGILPAIEGLRGMISRRIESKIEPEVQAASAEKEILKLARNEGGTVTPALAALHTTLSIEKAEEVLQSFVKKNFAVMRVTDDGRVEYEFPEFRRRIDDPSDGRSD